MKAYPKLIKNEFLESKEIALKVYYVKPRKGYKILYHKNLYINNT